MKGSILSQDEIDALLQSDRSDSLPRALVQLLTRVAENVSAWLGTAHSLALAVDGPYIERLSDSLSQSITDDSYALAADLGSIELFMFVSSLDGRVLAAHLNKTPADAVALLGTAWTKELGTLTSLPYQLYRPQLVNAEFLASLPAEKGSILARHLLMFSGSESIEFGLFLKNGHSQELVKRFETGLGTEASVGGRLLKGQKSPVTEAVFLPLDSVGGGGGAYGMDLLDDITLTVTVELGRTSLTLDQLLDMELQTVISLDRQAGEAVDVYVNNRLAAKGEVVVLDDHFGVRVLEIIAPSKGVAIDGR